MFRQLRENGPAVLVPLAWTFVVVAHFGTVASRTLLVAHVVIATLLAAFAVLSWTDMRAGALLVWRRIIVAGFGLTVAGAAGIALSDRRLLWIAVVGWMVLPAAGLWDTGRRAAATGGTPALAVRGYRVGGACSALGGVAYVLGTAIGTAATLAGLALVGIGQTAGIVAAVVVD